jgi:hypothetical protein
MELPFSRKVRRQEFLKVSAPSIHETLSTKPGRIRTCALEAKGFDLASGWITARKSLWERRLDRLGALLDEEG